MGILNRRNAFVGWVAWQVAKRVVRRKARGVVTGGGRGKAVAVSALAAAAAVAFFWWRRGGEERTDGE